MLDDTKFEQWKSKKASIDLQLETIEYRKQVDRTSKEVYDAVQKKLGFIPRSAEREIENLRSLGTRLGQFE